MKPVVSKFGGSSVANANQIRKVADIIRSDPKRRVIVVSAPGKRSKSDEKITDILISCHEYAQSGKDFRPRFQLIRDRYVEIAQDLGVGDDIVPVLDGVERSIADGADRSAVVSRGEFLGAHLISAYLGFEFVDASELIRFSDETTVDDGASDRLAQERLAGEGNYVIPGFYGAHADGRVQLFTRGGSDISASLIARALGAERYENWTDVSGLLSADPRVVDGPAPITEVSYEELRELAYLGANVFHDEAVAPVADANIPINIRNTNEPDHPGTRIVGAQAIGSRSSGTRIGVAGKTGFSGVVVSRSMLSKVADLPSRIGAALTASGVRAFHYALGSDSAFVVVESSSLEQSKDQMREQIVTELPGATVAEQGPYALVGAVGADFATRAGVLGNVLVALEKAAVPVHFISDGYSTSSFIVAVDEANYQKAIRELYTATES